MSQDGASYVSSGFGGWYDSQRREPCTPGLAADGMYRCLPAVGGYASTSFADSGCTTPVVAVFVSPGCTPYPPKYIGLYSAAAACTAATVGPKIYATGSETTTFYVLGSTCTGPNTNTNMSLSYFSATGGEIPPSDFEPMTSTTTTTP